MHDTEATRITSRRSNNERVALLRIRSMLSLRLASFSMNVSVDATYASGW